MKIIAFPFAGGNKYSFNGYFPTEFTVSVLEYPGRGLRTKESLIENLNVLVSDLLPQVEKEINTCDEYIIYGHSMGAWVGYLISKKIEELGFKKPLKLILSGAKPPKYTREKKISELKDQDFWDEVCELGGITEEMKGYPELIQYFIPILKADFKCIEGYQHKESLKLTMPIDFFYGSDEEINSEEASEWKNETTDLVNIYELKGNHFFIYKHKPFFVEYFKNLELNATV